MLNFISFLTQVSHNSLNLANKHLCFQNNSSSLYSTLGDIKLFKTKAVNENIEKFAYSECITNSSIFDQDLWKFSPDLMKLFDGNTPICYFDNIRQTAYAATVLFNICLFLQGILFLRYYCLSETLGPLIEALKKMTTDVFRFVVVLMYYSYRNIIS